MIQCKMGAKQSYFKRKMSVNIEDNYFVPVYNQITVKIVKVKSFINHAIDSQVKLPNKSNIYSQ